MRENLFDSPDFFERYDPMFSKNLAGKQLNRDHLSKSFQSNYHSQDSIYNQRNESFQFDEDINDKMDNLKREQYKKIKQLTEKVNDELFLKRNFDQKKYFS